MHARRGSSRVVRASYGMFCARGESVSAFSFLFALPVRLCFFILPGVDGGDELLRDNAAAGGAPDPTGAVPAQQPGGGAGPGRLHRLQVRIA